MHQRDWDISIHFYTWMWKEKDLLSNWLGSHFNHVPATATTTKLFHFMKTDFRFNFFSLFPLHTSISTVDFEGSMVRCLRFRKVFLTDHINAFICKTEPLLPSTHATLNMVFRALSCMYVSLMNNICILSLFTHERFNCIGQTIKGEKWN